MTLQFEISVTECDTEFKFVETRRNLLYDSLYIWNRAFQKNLSTSRMIPFRNRVKISRSEKIDLWQNAEKMHFLATFWNFLGRNFRSTFFGAITFQIIFEEKTFPGHGSTQNCELDRFHASRTPFGQPGTPKSMIGHWKFQTAVTFFVILRYIFSENFIWTSFFQKKSGRESFRQTCRVFL